MRSPRGICARLTTAASGTARRGARRRDRGVAVLEMVLVLPFLFLLMFGVGEFGLAWVSANKLEGAVSASARVGSAQGSSATADAAILTSLRSSISGELLANVERVVIFRSNSDGDIGAACLTASPGGGVSSGALRCNVYSQATLASATPTSVVNDSNWPPSTRRDRLSGPPDYLGVLVVTRHDDVTGTFWSGGFDLERRSIYRIQPDIDG